MWEQSLQTCRFCKKSDFDGGDSMVKYGVRHYAHHRCFLAAGKSLDLLHDWQVVQFPYAVLKEFNLLEMAAVAQARLDKEHAE